MRERTIKSINDKLIWLVVYILPAVLYVIASNHNSLLPFNEFLLTSGFGVLTNGVIYDMFASLFGSTGIVPIFSDNSFILSYITYMVGVTIIHVTFDIVVFLPRLFHQFFEKLNKGELL